MVIGNGFNSQPTVALAKTSFELSGVDQHPNLSQMLPKGGTVIGVYYPLFSLTVRHSEP